MARLVYTVLALSLALPTVAAASDITDFCNLRDGAAISDKCFGFVSAVIENVVVLQETHRASGYENACIPFDMKVKEAMPKIRPILRRRMCDGKCSATTYVESALFEAYPCKSPNQPTAR